MEPELVAMIRDLPDGGELIMVELERSLWDPWNVRPANAHWEALAFIRCEHDEKVEDTWYIAVQIQAETDDETWIGHMTMCRGQRKRTDDGMSDEQWSRWCDGMTTLVKRFGEYTNDWMPTVYNGGRRVTLELSRTSELHTMLHDMYIDVRRSFWFQVWTQRSEFHVTFDRVLRSLPPRAP